jgi:DNA excision repair protein ERCC-2
MPCISRHVVSGSVDVYFAHECSFSDRCSYLSEQFAHPEVGKLIYCTRTVPEMSKVRYFLWNQKYRPSRCNISFFRPLFSHFFQCIQEVRRVIEYRASTLGTSHPQSRVLGLCLSSRYSDLMYSMRFLMVKIRSFVLMPRRNMCIHSDVMEESERDAVDSLCR